MRRLSLRLFGAAAAVLLLATACSASADPAEVTGIGTTAAPTTTAVETTEPERLSADTAAAAQNASDITAAMAGAAFACQTQVEAGEQPWLAYPELAELHDGDIDGFDVSDDAAVDAAIELIARIAADCHAENAEADDAADALTVKVWTADGAVNSSASGAISYVVVADLTWDSGSAAEPVCFAEMLRDDKPLAAEYVHLVDGNDLRIVIDSAVRAGQPTPQTVRFTCSAGGLVAPPRVIDIAWPDSFCPDYYESCPWDEPDEPALPETNEPTVSGGDSDDSADPADDGTAVQIDIGETDTPDIISDDPDAPQPTEKTQPDPADGEPDRFSEDRFPNSAGIWPPTATDWPHECDELFYQMFRYTHQSSILWSDHLEPYVEESFEFMARNVPVELWFAYFDAKSNAVAAAEDWKLSGCVSWHGMIPESSVPVSDYIDDFQLYLAFMQAAADQVGLVRPAQ